MTNEAVTVGLVTHQRSTLLTQCLQYLKLSVEAYSGNCDVIIVNNSGVEAYSLINKIVNQSEIGLASNTVIINSPKNNISTGRNIILENTKTELVIMLDDDEKPVKNWITELVDYFERSQCAVVAGPTIPIFPASTHAWIKAVDLHNTRQLKTGDSLGRVGAGNCLMYIPAVGDLRFDTDFGSSGGEDTLFFDQLVKAGHTIEWCVEAMMYETIDAERCTPKYMKNRFITQGYTFKLIMMRDKGRLQQLGFIGKAALIAPFSIALGYVFMPFNITQCANWLKRGYSNLGKLLPTTGNLYE